MQVIQIKALKAKTLLKKTHISPLLAMTSVGLALIGIFALSSWAESTPLNHGVQHLVIFISGVGFGVFGLKSGKDVKK